MRKPDINALLKLAAEMKDAALEEDVFNGRDVLRWADAIVEHVGDQTPCHAAIHHGPGHQGRQECYLKGPHEVHETRYGCDDRLVRWRGDSAFTGYFDEPKEIDE